MSSTDNSAVNGLLELIERSPIEILNSFRNNYDMCESSGFFPVQTLLDVNHCGLIFRSLGLNASSVATLTSNDCIPKMIFFYENLAIMDSKNARKGELDLMGTEAKKLGKIFHIIAVWAINLSNETQRAILNVLAASDKFTNEFSSELEKAEKEFTVAQEGLKETQKSFLLYGLVGQAKARVSEAERNLSAARQRYEKGQVIANVAANLGKALANMELEAKEIATFWMEQFQNWTSQGSKMILTEADNSLQLLKFKGPEDSTFWKQVKQQFDKFAEVMTKVTDMYNFPGEASSPVPTTQLHIPELNYSMAVPSVVNVDSIMAD